MKKDPKSTQQSLELGIDDFGSFGELIPPPQKEQAHGASGAGYLLTFILLFALIRSQYGYMKYTLPSISDTLIGKIAGEVCRGPESSLDYNLNELYPDQDPADFKSDFTQNFSQISPYEWQDLFNDKLRGFAPAPPPEAVSFVAQSCINTLLFPGQDVYDPAQQLTLKVAFQRADGADIAFYDLFVSQTADILSEFNDNPASRLHIEFVDSASERSVLTFVFGVNYCSPGLPFRQEEMGGCAMMNGNVILINGSNGYVDSDTIRHEFLHAVANFNHLFDGQGREFEEFFGTNSMSVMAYPEDTSIVEDNRYGYSGWGFLDQIFINTFFLNSGPYGPAQGNLTVVGHNDGTILNGNPDAPDGLEFRDMDNAHISLDPRFIGRLEDLQGWSTLYLPETGTGRELIKIDASVRNATILLGDTDQTLNNSRFIYLGNNSTQLYLLEPGMGGNNVIFQNNDSAKPVELALFYPSSASMPFAASLDESSNQLTLSNGSGDSFTFDYSQGIVLSQNVPWQDKPMQTLYINDRMSVEQINTLLEAFGTTRYDEISPNILEASAMTNMPIWTDRVAQTKSASLRRG